jgi:hypothetical protein
MSAGPRGRGKRPQLREEALLGRGVEGAARRRRWLRAPPPDVQSEPDHHLAPATACVGHQTARTRPQLAMQLATRRISASRQVPADLWVLWEMQLIRN